MHGKGDDRVQAKWKDMLSSEPRLPYLWRRPERSPGVRMNSRDRHTLLPLSLSPRLHRDLCDLQSYPRSSPQMSQPPLNDASHCMASVSTLSRLFPQLATLRGNSERHQTSAGPLKSVQGPGLPRSWMYTNDTLAYARVAEKRGHGSKGGTAASHTLRDAAQVHRVAF